MYCILYKYERNQSASWLSKAISHVLGMTAAALLSHPRNVCIFDCVCIILSRQSLAGRPLCALYNKRIQFSLDLISQSLSLSLPIPPTSLVASITIIAKFGAAIGCSSEPPLCLALFAQQCLTKIENSSFYCIHCLRHHHLFSSNLWPNRRKDCVCIERWTKDLSEWNLRKSPQIFSWHCFPCMRKMNLCGNGLKTMKMCSILHLFFLPQQ